jgi:hypothetical protein
VKRLRLSPLAVAALLAAACAATPDSGSVREHFEEGRVDVEIHLERDATTATIVATFRPTSPDLHLYGLDLPRDGIDGAGRPTRIDVVDPAWMTVGSVSDEPRATLVPIAGFDEPFPTYPEGPVTLRQAIRASGESSDHSVDVAVTFMACSTGGLCFKPEIDHVMAVPVP